MITRAVGALIDIIIMLIRYLFTGKIKPEPKISSATISLIENEWRQIDSDLKTKSPSVLKHALIKADKSLDNLLKEVSSGNSMGERMISGKNKFAPEVYSSIWSGHKIRNSMVHDSGFEPTVAVLYQAIEDLRKGVKSLGARV